jgi:hypothetical protein
MKIVNINRSPTVCDKDGSIRGGLTDLNKILNTIDSAHGRNDALRAYIYALRDLQRAHDQSVFAGYGTPEQKDERIDQAQAAAAKAFDRLIVAEFSLNRPATVASLRDEL